MKGWVKIHRKILDHYLFQEDRVFSKYEAWQYILLMVNHKSNKFLLGNELIELKAGQMVTSQSKLMKRFKWSKSKLRSFLRMIETDGMIRVDSDTKKTILTVVKYSDYQHSETAKKPRKDRKETASRLREDTNKNEKNEKNENNDKEEIKERPKKPKKVFSEDVINCYYSILPFFDELNQPKKDSEIVKWQDTIDKLNRIDGLSFEDIIHLTQKTRQDDFWSKNFLTINKLRTKNKEGVLFWKVFYNQFKTSKNEESRDFISQAASIGRRLHPDA